MKYGRGKTILGDNELDSITMGDGSVILKKGLSDNAGYLLFIDSGSNFEIGAVATGNVEELPDPNFTLGFTDVKSIDSVVSSLLELKSIMEVADE